jgi:integrase
VSWGDGSYWYDDERGRWFGQVLLGRGPDGRLVRPKRSGRTKAEVRAKLRQLREEFEAGVSVGDDVLFGEFAPWWLAEVAPARRGRNGQPAADSTLEKDRALVVHHPVPALGRYRLRDLRPEHIEAMLRHKLTEEGLGHDRVRRLRARCVDILRHAERRGRVRHNADLLSVMPRPTAEPERRRSLSVEQAKRLMDASTGDRLHAMVVVGLMLGLRPGELRGLTWADIDLRSGTLRVSGVEKGGRRVDDVKVGHERAKRTLVMPAPVAESLRAHRRQWELERAVAERWENDDFVFTTTVGTALDRNNVVRALRRLCRKAGLGDDWTTYELRHTAASLLYDAGVPKERIAEILGHADTRMLDQVYRHPLREALTHAAGPMDLLFA